MDAKIEALAEAICRQLDWQENKLRLKKEAKERAMAKRYRIKSLQKLTPYDTVSYTRGEYVQTSPVPVQTQSAPTTAEWWNRIRQTIGKHSNRS